MEELPCSEPSPYGLKIPLNYTFPMNSKQVIEIKPRQALAFLPLTMRYLSYYVDVKLRKKKPIMDYITQVSAQRIYGCPIGGIGGGTIGRGFRGEFCRFNLFPGDIQYTNVPECQFIVNIRNAANETIFQSVMSTYEKPKKAPHSWEWNLNGAECEYTALYPRAWTTYDLSKYGVKLVCRQISPVIPHNYKDSSLPCAVFVWNAKNVGEEPRTVSITFTWKEIGSASNKKTGKVDLERYAETHTSGVSIEQRVHDTPCTFTIAKRKTEHESIHHNYCMFDSRTQSAYVWRCLHDKGCLEPELDRANLPPADRAGDDQDRRKKKRCTWDSVGLSSSVTLNPGDDDIMEFCLSWDMPNIQFRKNQRTYRRYYTKFFGSDGLAGAGVAAYALKHYRRWERELAAWQQPILNNPGIPGWLKGALMNELYYIADGGTIWFDTHEDYQEDDPRHSYGIFGYLEGHEYRMYNTYDVHFYASFALAQLWPNLQVVIQYLFLDTITQQSKESMNALYDGKHCKRKVKDSVPHDLGDPDEAPFSRINAYNVHDVSEWRDLNSKFILQVMRDYQLLRRRAGACDAAERFRSLEFIDDVHEGMDLYQRCVQTKEAETTEPAPSGPAGSGNILAMLYSEDDKPSSRKSSSASSDESARGEHTWSAERYAADMYDACCLLVRRTSAWDRDKDGLIENMGAPDQTFDAWVMTGPSAYCGGLWLTALFFVKHLASLLKRPSDEAEFEAMLSKAKHSYEEKLWNGSFYSFDTRPANRGVVMAAQLCGHWYLRAAGFAHEVLQKEHVVSSLRTIYENNVLKFRDGKLGAVNGYVLDKHGGHVDHTAMQSEEMWTGVTFALAALMLHEGMTEEAWRTAGGLVHTMSRDMGLNFETPEALTESGNHRSVAYMRPLAIWAMYHALSTQPDIPVAASQQETAVATSQPETAVAPNGEAQREL